MCIAIILGAASARSTSTLALKDAHTSHFFLGLQAAAGSEHVTADQAT